MQNRIIGDMLVNGAADIWDLMKSLNFKPKIEHKLGLVSFVHLLMLHKDFPSYPQNKKYSLPRQQLWEVCHIVVSGMCSCFAFHKM